MIRLLTQSMYLAFDRGMTCAAESEMQGDYVKQELAHQTLGVERGAPQASAFHIRVHWKMQWGNFIPN